MLARSRVNHLGEVDGLEARVVVSSTGRAIVMIHSLVDTTLVHNRRLIVLIREEINTMPRPIKCWKITFPAGLFEDWEVLIC